MKTPLLIILGILLTSFQSFCQTNITFTGVVATPERAIQLHWQSNSNEIYQIQYANGFATNSDGSTAWTTLYDDYPSHGTNTFWLDTGDYVDSPNIPHPKYSGARFYRIFSKGFNTAAANPVVAITSPANGDVVSSNLTVSVSSSSSDTIANLKLYVDGQEMKPSPDGTNFTINTCEWWNGSHVLFATAKSLSHFEGAPNDTSILYGRSVSFYVTVNFSNLISEVQFSQPYFEPSLGQTQEVTAVLSANSDWTVQVVDVYDNPVRTATGFGNSLLFDWDGTGDGETNLPDGSYSYLISAATNGLPNELPIEGGGGGGGGGSPPSPDDDSMSLFAVNTNISDAVLPLAIFPPGSDTNGYTIFEATPSEVRSLRTTSIRPRVHTSLLSDGGHFTPMGIGASGSSQVTLTPNRPPTVQGKGTIGTFYCGYQDYWTPSGTFSAAAIPTGNPIVNKWVQVDGEANQTAASHSETFASASETPDIAKGFSAAMTTGRYKGSVNPFVTASQVTGGVFNNANVGLLMCHASYATTSESDGVTRSYLRFFNTFGGAPTYIKLDSCNFGGGGTNGLKWMAILGCSVLNGTDYNSLHFYGRLPINSNLHLLLSTSTVATFAPTLGGRWAGFMLGDGTTNNPPETVEQSWFDAGTKAYDNSNGQGETQSITITFRVAGWPDAFSEHLSDVNNSPSTGDVLDITKQDSTVYSF